MSHHIVVVILEAKTGKEDELKKALMNVIKPSRAEQSNLEYRLYQDNTNHAQFILYERWISKEAHAEQFKKPYVIELGSKIDELLAKPYQVHFSRELE